MTDRRKIWLRERLIVLFVIGAMVDILFGDVVGFTFTGTGIAVLLLKYYR